MPGRSWLAVALVVLTSSLPATAARAQDDVAVLANAGPFKIERRGRMTRLLHGGILWGAQVNENHLGWADAAVPLGAATPWEVLAAEGVLGRWDATQEPLTYYHRTGPVGAVFHHLRTRKAGADAAAPIGVVGMNAATPAAYARRGQSVTFYESHPELMGLIVGTRRYFTYLHDARSRGAVVQVQPGPVRRTLAADDKRFAVLLVELFETGFDPGDRLTLEAVRLYVDRVTPDGLVALHVSNREYRLEPVVERIARELKLVARVWYDSDAESNPGKAASGWVVLARSDAALGPLGRPMVEQIAIYGTRNEPLAHLLRTYRPDRNAVEVMRREWGGPESEWPQLTHHLVGLRYGPRAREAYWYALRYQERGQVTLGQIAEVVFGQMFRPLVADPQVELRTDAHRPELPPANPPAKK